MTILVLGTITRDTNVYLGQPPIESLGGILHNVVALAAMTEETIVPIANVGVDIYDSVVSRLNTYPNIALNGLNKVVQPNNHCFLFYVLEYPAEVLVGRVPPILFSQVKPYLSKSTLIMVNFTSGFDLTLHTLRRISEAASCSVFLGYQLLGLGIDSLGNRYLRRRRNWLQWTAIADFVQLNRFEAEHICGGSLSGNAEAREFAEPILKGRPKMVIITSGEEGAFVIYKQRGEIESVHIPAYPVMEIVDASGCGDVFSSAFITHYLHFHDAVLAARFASYVASKKCGVPGLANLDKVIPEIKSADEWNRLIGVNRVQGPV
jgi:hypothetical protein